MNMVKSEAPIEVALITTVVGMQMPSGWVKVSVGHVSRRVKAAQPWFANNRRRSRFPK